AVPTRPVRLVAAEGVLPPLGDGRELSLERRRDPAVDPDVALAVVELDRAALADPREELAGRVRDVDVDVDPQRGQQRGDLDTKRVEPEPGQGADQDRTSQARRRGA